MSVSTDDWLSVVEFLGAEAEALDGQDWDRWLALYAEDCVYWLPAWRSDGRLVEDPKSELSLIYYGNRVGLESRVFRLRTGRVSSAVELPRTAHLFTPVAMEATEAGMRVRAHWSTHSVYESRVSTYCGHAFYELSREVTGWLIRSKKTVLLNDRVHEVLDFYNV
jgi:benzoate/toluate 1,2-dioxygenase subunit beta